MSRTRKNKKIRNAKDTKRDAETGIERNRTAKPSETSNLTNTRSTMKATRSKTKTKMTTSTATRGRKTTKLKQSAYVSTFGISGPRISDMPERTVTSEMQAKKRNSILACIWPQSKTKRIIIGMVLFLVLVLFFVTISVASYGTSEERLENATRIPIAITDESGNPVTDQEGNVLYETSAESDRGAESEMIRRRSRICGECFYFLEFPHHNCDKVVCHSANIRIEFDITVDIPQYTKWMAKLQFYRSKEKRDVNVWHDLPCRINGTYGQCNSKTKQCNTTKRNGVVSTPESEEDEDEDFERRTPTENLCIQDAEVNNFFDALKYNVCKTEPSCNPYKIDYIDCKNPPCWKRDINEPLHWSEWPIRISKCDKCKEKLSMMEKKFVDCSSAKPVAICNFSQSLKNIGGIGDFEPCCLEKSNEDSTPKYGRCIVGTCVPMREE